MKKFRFLFMTMLAVAVCCGFTACGDDDDDDEPGNNGGGTVVSPEKDPFAVPTVGNTPDALLGKWTYSYVDDEGDAGSMSFQFKHRGICTFYYDDEFATLGECNASGNKLTINVGGIMYNGTYSVSGDKLIYKATMSEIDYPDESYTMELTFKKVSSEIGFEPAPVDDSLVGVWYADGCHRFTFLSNGCAQYLQVGDDYDTILLYFAYSVNDGKFTCYDAEGNKTLTFFGFNDVPYQVNGDKLTITVLNSDGSYDSMVFTKVYTK
ncbi:MAG: hypothetical protein K2L31_00030 [Muribaculum sp.]|nr:hypothetical protein [Muribaculum sp.]